ncbi:dnaK suppressor protein, partial [Pseudomonas syringae pv. pisi str. 1704B]
MALMSVEQLLDQAEDEYMSGDQLAFFKDRLEVKAAELRDRLLS